MEGTIGFWDSVGILGSIAFAVLCLRWVLGGVVEDLAEAVQEFTRQYRKQRKHQKAKDEVVASARGAVATALEEIAEARELPEDERASFFEEKNTSGDLLDAIGNAESDALREQLLRLLTFVCELSGEPDKVEIYNRLLPTR